MVSVLYREPKLLKGGGHNDYSIKETTVSVLYREPKLLKVLLDHLDALFREFQCSTVSRNC